MASKFSFLNSIIERKKPSKEKTDELAVVKAAAWAWYEHGSGSEGSKGTSEFDVTRTQRAHNRPSRYKLEAMRMAKEGSPIHTKKPLLDPYEVQSISRQLDSLIESNSNHNKLDNSANASLDIGGRKMKKKKNIRKWFWQRHGAVCGRGDDVIDPRALRDGRRQPAKPVPAVKMVKCLPMANNN